MTTYFVGGELDSVVIYSPVGVSESGAGNTAISGFTRGAIRIENSVYNNRGVGCYMINPTTGARASATGTIWTHFSAYFSNSNNTTWVPVQWFNAAGTAVFRLIMAGNNAWQPQYWNGTAWANMGTAQVFQTTTGNTVVDFKITLGASGNFRYLLNNLEMSNVTLDLSMISDIARLDLGCNGADIYYHQIIIADYNTIGHTVRRRSPSGNGTNVAWAGTYDGVDEFGLTDSDGISTSAVGAKETFAGNALSATESGKVIKAVAVAARVRTDEDSVPRSVKAVVRVGSTDYESPKMIGTDNYTYGGAIVIFEKDPSTGADWASITNVNGEFGLKSDT